MADRLTKYSGLTTKVRAMKNKLLTEDQYLEMSRLNTVADFVSYLQNIPAYSEVLKDVNPHIAHRGEIESRMRFSAYEDFSKLYHFTGISEKKALLVYFMKYEVHILKIIIREIMDSRSIDIKDNTANKHFRRYSNCDIAKLLTSNNMEEFVENLAGSIYYKPMKVILSMENPSLFDYEMNLDLFYFRYLWKHKEEFIPKGELPLFEKLFASRIDLLNLLWIYRSKKYFVVPNSEIYSFLIPVYYKISQNEIKQMVESDSDEEILDLIKNTHYGSFYDIDVTENLGSQFEEILTGIYLDIFKSNPYSVTCISAYFMLKNTEVSKIVMEMECIRYGYPSTKTMEIINRKRGVL